MKQTIVCILILLSLFAVVPAQAQDYRASGITSYVTGIDSVLLSQWLAIIGIHPMFLMSDYSRNNYITNVRTATDTSSFSVIFTESGKPEMLLNGITGETYFSIDSTGLTTIGANLGLGTATPFHHLSIVKADPTLNMVSSTYNLNRTSAATASDTSCFNVTFASGTPTLTMKNSVGTTIFSVSGTGNVTAAALSKSDTSYARSSKFGRIDPDTVRVTTNVISDSLNARSVKFTRTSIDTLGLGIDGIVSLPALRWQSDPNCGLYRLATDNIGLVAGGSLMINITSTGVNLGAGLSPKHNLANYNVTTTNATLPALGIVSSTHNLNRLNRDTAEDTSAVYARITSTGAPVFGMRDANGTQVMIVDSTANHGIGTSTPYGSSTRGTNALWFKDGTAPAGGTAYQAGIFADSLVDDAHTELFCMDAAGNVTQLTAADELIMKKIDNEGNVTEIDIEALAAEIEAITGKTFIKRSKITPWPHEEMPYVPPAEFYLERTATELLNKWQEAGTTDFSQLFTPDGSMTEVLKYAVEQEMIGSTDLEELVEANKASKE